VDFIRRNWRKPLFFLPVTLVLLGGGVAVAAAFLFATPVAVTPTFEDQNVAATFTGVSGTKEGIDCSSAKDDGKETVTVSPVVKRIAFGTEKKVVVGDCLISGTLTNKGTAPIKITGVSLKEKPAGWSAVLTNIAPGQTLAAGATQAVTFRLSAAADAVDTPFTAQIDLATLDSVG
jgi:hypothetical protein